MHRMQRKCIYHCGADLNRAVFKNCFSVLCGKGGSGAVGNLACRRRTGFGRACGFAVSGFIFRVQRNRGAPLPRQRFCLRRRPDACAVPQPLVPLCRKNGHIRGIGCILPVRRSRTQAYHAVCVAVSDLQGTWHGTASVRSGFAADCSFAFGRDISLCRTRTARNFPPVGNFPQYFRALLLRGCAAVCPARRRIARQNPRIRAHGHYRFRLTAEACTACRYQSAFAGRISARGRGQYFRLSVGGFERGKQRRLSGGQRADCGGKDND